MASALLFKWEDSPALCKWTFHPNSLSVCLLVATASTTAKLDTDRGRQATTAVSARDLSTTPARDRHAMGRMQVC